MNLHERFFRVRRLTVCLVLVLFSALATRAQSEKVFNLSEFNPVANGVADDGPAFQKAFDALAAAGGGTLLIPAGKYKILTPVEKDFASVPDAKVTIQGVPSSKMPAPVTASGNELAEGLNLQSDITPATGRLKSAFTIRNLNTFLIEHVGFSGTPESETDAFITLNFIDVDKATVRHCEFYGISTFGVLPDLGGGNIVRAIRSELSIELTVFLGCTGNSGAYAALVENIEWKKFSISNSIFLDYGLREFFSKTGLGAPLSWINIGNPAAPTPESPRREIIVRDTFLDEGGWVGISALPYRYTPWDTLVDLIYISGLKMNVPNMGTAGHLFYDGKNLLIENSHYGWSTNAYSALDINRFENVILDKLTCVAPSFNANRIITDDRTDRLTVINSVYTDLVSQARTITVLETAPEDDPVQYVRTRFVTSLGRQPDPAAHFYWSDLLIKCGSNNECLNEKRSALNAYLSSDPKENFAVAAIVTDENGDPVNGVAINLTGSQTAAALTDAQGRFRFSGLPTSGSYTLTVNKRHYSFATAKYSVLHPAADVSLAVDARLDRHSIEGRITRGDGQGLGGVNVQLGDLTASTDSDGFYLFPDLAAGKNYTVVPSLDDFVLTPGNMTFEDLSEDRVVNFSGKLTMFALTGIVTDENGDPLSDALVSLTGSLSGSAMTDSAGSFRFEALPTDGSYTVTITKPHYTFATSSRDFSQPIDHVDVSFNARLNRHSITGRLTRFDGAGMSGVVVRLAESPSTTATTDANGFYTFADLVAGENYTVVPVGDFVFAPASLSFNELAANATANFVGKLEPELIMSDGTELAVALDSVSFVMQPFSFFNPFGFSTDGLIRVMIFATNLDPVSPSQVLVVAKDGEGKSHPLEVEFMGAVPGQSWLKQLNLKVPSQTLGGKCVQLQLTVAEVNSNNGRVCFGNVGSQSLQTR